MEFPAIIRPIFERAGWYPERQVEPSIPQVDSPAYRIGRQILANLEGLHVGKSGPGHECAASDIKFDPAEAAECLTEFFGIFDHSLCPLATYHNSHGVLYVSGDGALYHGDLVGDSGLSVISGSFFDGIGRILLGIQPYEKGA
jgi:hypothetical protein